MNDSQKYLKARNDIKDFYQVVWDESLRKTIKELAEKIKCSVGYQGNFTFNTSKPDGTMQKLTNVARLHSLGWKHSIDLEKGVEKMYAWYLS